MDTLYELGITLIQVLQTLSPGLDIPMAFFSFLGTIEFYLLLIPLLFWVVDLQLGLRVLLVLICADVVGLYFKHLLHHPRPYWVGDVQALSTEPSYGMPSTHASDTLSIWSYLVYHAQRRWLLIIAVLLILIIGLSRLYLGVHFPQDVVVGWLIGLGAFYLFVKFEKRVLSWMQKQNLGSQIGVGFGTSAVLIGLGLLVGILISVMPAPEVWAGFATEARSPSHYFTLGGSLFGAIAGFALMRQYAQFRIDATWVRKGSRFILGIIGVVIVWRGLDVLFGLIAPDETVFGYILRYIRYAATTLWVMFGAPWVFLRLSLAHE